MKKKHREASQSSFLRKLAEGPMGPWERRVFDEPAGTAIAAGIGRGDLNRNERWLPNCFVNNRYAVQCSSVKTGVGEVLHLWIRRHDGEAVRSWSDLQRIKDELIGPERVAVEVFPPRSELVDSANMYHLWVYPEDFVMPFTLRSAARAERAEREVEPAL